MLKTKVKQDYQLNGEIKTEILFIRILDVFYKNSDGRIILYIEKGFVDSYVDEATDETITRYNLLSNVPTSYTQEEFKTVLTAAGVVFNSSESNLLIDEQNIANTAIITALIAADNTKFFGISSDDWE